jgi:asparagine synthase (glutamine-hydrolysing)
VFRYIALVWNNRDPAASAAGQRLSERLQLGLREWRMAVQQSGLVVFYAGARAGSSEPYLLQRGAGVVLGKLFARSSAAHSDDASSRPQPLALGAELSAKVLATRGRHLIEHYWGRYVAFLHDAAAGATWVLRDPTACLPCLYLESSLESSLEFRGVEVYFSSLHHLMDDSTRLGLDAFSINWKYIAAHFCYQRLQIRETGLNDVSQVLGGECIELYHGQKTRTFYWDPLHFIGRADSQASADPAQVAAELQSSTTACVRAWASCYSGILHTLSGGLDSSIVVACLHGAPTHPKISCVNYHSPGADGDERAFARLAAGRAGCELIERARDPGLNLESLRGVLKSPTPINYRYYLENSRAEAQLAHDLQATALFSGEGGDQLFYQSPGVFAAGDYLCRRGLLRGMGPALFRIALDAAHMDRLSVWQVLREGFLGRRWSSRDELGRFKKLIPAEVIEAVRNDARFMHPWFQAPRQLPNGKVWPSGKIWHAYSLSFVPMEFYDPLGPPEGPERVVPLFSQPLIELCLRIPTELLTLGGWDRALARRAFQHAVPRAIITRRTKGGLEEYCKAILWRNIGLVREMLLDGFLVREKIIDRNMLEDVLSDRPTRIGSGTVEIYDCLNVEAWLGRWV